MNSIVLNARWHARTVCRSAALFLVPLSGLLLSASAIHAEEWDEEHAFDVAPGQAIVFALDAGGDVTVRGDRGAESRGEARIDVEVTGRDAEFVDVSVEKTATGLLVTSRSSRPKKWRHSIGIQVVVPSTFDVKVDSNGGDFDAQDLAGEVLVNSRGGDLRLEACEGTMKLNTLGGDIRLERALISGSADTNGGDVVLDNVGGELTIRTLGGDVYYDGGSQAGKAPDAGLRLETYGGDIAVRGAPAGAWLRTKGGEIRVTDTRGDIDAESLGGDLWIETGEGNVQARTIAGEVVVVKRGGGDLLIDATGGEVSITLPNDFSMNLEARLEGGEFDSDFEIKADGPLRFGTGRTEIRGRHGSGENLVQIRTSHSDVRIKQKG